MLVKLAALPVLIVVIAPLVNGAGASIRTIVGPSPNVFTRTPPRALYGLDVARLKLTHARSVGKSAPGSVARLARLVLG
jgi:hypothetical protein